MGGKHWNTWEKYLTGEDTGRAQGRKCWKAWGDILPFEPINEMVPRGYKYWRAWERFSHIADPDVVMSSVGFDRPDLPEKALT
jgi:hypothetical protein